MKLFFFFTLITLLFISFANGQSNNGTGPLYLSNYLQNPTEGVKLSIVENIGNFSSYAGYFTVNSEDCGSNIFFWFFPSQNGNQSAPLIAWLQGGPGASSLDGLFTENGPFKANETGTGVKFQPYNWNQKYHMVFIDNPVGVGFSYTENATCYVQSETDVANDLYSMLTQFFTIYSDYQPNDFYVSGESYGGRYSSSITDKIYRENQNDPEVFINLKGLTVGDGSIDPETQMSNYSSLLYQWCLADNQQVDVIDQYQDNIVSNIQQGNFTAAFHYFDEFLNGDFTPYPTYFTNITQLSNYFNILQPTYPPNPFTTFLDLPSTKQAIHVGDRPFWGYNGTVEYYLIDDWMRSSKSEFRNVIENYKTMVYSGGLDIILGGAQTENFLQTFEWSGREDYLKSDRKIWRVANETAGYIRVSNQFWQAIVLGAGHMVPQDQPQRAYDLIQRFIDDVPVEMEIPTQKKDKNQLTINN